MFLRYIPSGLALVSPGDNLDAVLDAIVQNGYGAEFCLTFSLERSFIAELMRAGFLVMSEYIGPEDIIIEPMHHLVRSVLFLDRVHEGKTIQRFLPGYEFAFDRDFDRIITRCAEVHGDGWLTKPLTEAIRAVKALGKKEAMPASFGVYRGGELKAGEFGVISGGVYTSYSGYHDESNAGKAQMVLTARWLREQGFAFWDLGMPLEYKNKLGAANVSLKKFLSLFRKARTCSPRSLNQF
ncbi:MAG: GNAT family N-acetyltransferase [Spirochaetaceae bacterium]|jgi:Leu/Phe-tRNA-protein transferase|nr:GNAT family N-acetyltransferase [Spirochaetaceae bacterium]